MPIFAHPRFGPQKKPVFCLRSNVFGMLPTCFFVFFYIDFVFFFMNFAYFPVFFVKFSACANANWQISGVITSIISELAKVQSPNKNGKSVEICRSFCPIPLPLLLLYPSASDFQFRYAPVTVGSGRVEYSCAFTCAVASPAS